MTELQRDVSTSEVWCATMVGVMTVGYCHTDGDRKPGGDKERGENE